MDPEPSPPQCPGLGHIPGAGLGSCGYLGSTWQDSRKKGLTSDPLPQDLEPLLARDQDLQQLRQGQVLPAARAPLSWKQQLEAFDNYLYLVYGPALLVGGVLPHTSLDPAPSSSLGL